MVIRPLAALGLVLACASVGCVDGPNDLIRITEIEVTGEIDLGALDVEVHLYDALDHTHLGCSGQDHGLEDVDENDTPYAVSAYFERSGSRGDLTLPDLIGHAVEVQVIEDDADPCPAPAGPDDDVIGISTEVDIVNGVPAAFDDVTYLRIVVQ